MDAADVLIYKVEGVGPDVKLHVGQVQLQIEEVKEVST